MPIAVYNLRPKASYDSAVKFTMEVFRALLREEREARVGGRDSHAELAGVNRTTIQNIETGTDIPGLDTVAKLVEAMPGLTLSSFFARIEGLQFGDAQLDNTTPPADKDRHAPTGVADDAISRATFDTFLDKLGSQLQRSLVEGIVQSQRERKTPARTKAKSKGRTKNRKDARRRA